MRPVALRTELLDSPLGLGTAHPCFDWRVVDAAPGGFQAAYRIQVEDAASATEVWDSGEVAGHRPFGVRYAGQPLVSSRAYQSSGRPVANNRDDRLNYSHAQSRPLDAEVLLDAICDVTGVPEVFTTAATDSAKPSGQAPSGTRAIQLRESDLFYSRFLELYGRPNRLTVPERSPKP